MARWGISSNLHCLVRNVASSGHVTTIMLAVLPAGTCALQISSILIDSSNLQLNVNPRLASSLSSRSIEQLPESLHLLSRYLAYLDPWGDDVPPDSPLPASVVAVYDGTAYYGEHAGQTWLQKDEPEGAPVGGDGIGMQVMFTAGAGMSADDELIKLARDSSGQEPRPLQPITANAALESLEGELPRSVIAVARLRSVSGKSQRKQREVQLRLACPSLFDLTAHTFCCACDPLV